MERIKRKQVTINISSISATEFRLYCKSKNLPMNTIIETFMLQFLSEGFTWEIKNDCFLISDSKYPVNIDRVKKTAIITSLDCVLYEDFKYWCKRHDVTTGIVIEAFIKHLVKEDFCLFFKSVQK